MSIFTSLNCQIQWKPMLQISGKKSGDVIRPMTSSNMQLSSFRRVLVLAGKMKANVHEFNGNVSVLPNCLSFRSDLSFEPIKVISLFPINPLYYFRGAIINTSILSFLLQRKMEHFSLILGIQPILAIYVPVHVFRVHVSLV